LAKVLLIMSFHEKQRMQVVRIACVVAAMSILVGRPPVNRADDSIGPATEDRFPPLVVPAGFRATLFACDPLVEYPSVIALGPRQGTLFVAHDYMTGLGVEIVRRDEVRLVEDTDQDGYADKSTVYAGGFNSIQGLAYSAGAVYVMHAPLLTVLRDVDNDGQPDERDDLIKGLGLPPEENSNRLHCANGVVAAHDGWLYLALGDRGCDVARPEGDRLLFRQGGILRCRTDGSDLHVHSSGLRNIYDVALDDQLNVFVRDNENDGGEYMIRVYHCFHGSDHGYPYHYYERPDEAYTPMADLGRGSAAGGVCYTGTSFPPEYQGNLFFCEWGRAVVRYPRERLNGGFAPTREIDFVAAAENDPYGLKPTDLIIDYDGSLLISDWGDGQRPKRGRGRIYRIQSESADRSLAAEAPHTESLSASELVALLNSPRAYERVAAQQAIAGRISEMLPLLREALRVGSLNPVARFHAVWILAELEDQSAVEELFEVATGDPDPSVRAHAIRAIADVADPVLAQHRLNAGRGDQELADRLARLADRVADGRVTLEVLIALRRLQWKDAPQWSASTTTVTDHTLAHAAMQLLRSCDNWPGVMSLLDRAEPADGMATNVRTIALRAIAEQAETVVVDGLISRLHTEVHPGRRRQLVDALTRVQRKPAPWTYWGFRPGPRPANTQHWERSDAITRTLNRILFDENHDLRGFLLRRMLREEISIDLETLGHWVGERTAPRHVAVIIDALRKRPAKEARPLFHEIVADQLGADSNRLAALDLLIAGMDTSTESLLATLARQVEDGPVLAGILSELGKRSNISADELLVAKLDSREPSVRAAAIRALGQRSSTAVKATIPQLLSDDDIGVRAQAVVAAGMLRIEEVGDRVLQLAADPDPGLRRACFGTLRQLKDGRAVQIAVKSLARPATRLAAFAYLQELGDPRDAPSVTAAAGESRDAEVHHAAIQALSAWVGRTSSEEAGRLQETIAKLQGTIGVLCRWQSPTNSAGTVTYFASGVDSRVQSQDALARNTAWHATSEVLVDQAIEVEFLASSNGALTVSLNDENVFSAQQKGPYRPDANRFAATLKPGMNRLAVRITDAESPVRFHVRFRKRNSKAEHERLVQFVLSGRGNAERGREVFRNADKSACLTCHRLGAEGENIGPDLSGIGRRLSRVHILESILEPSRTIAPSYETIVVVLADGRVLSGVKVLEDDSTLTLGDALGKTHPIKKVDIDEKQLQSKSTMPDGLAEKLSDREFIDLIAYLTSLID
jgi:putative membrane-bound dehydrogenase-like protein